MAAVPPFTKILPDPALIVVPAAWVTPLPLKEAAMSPTEPRPAVVMSPLRVIPPVPPETRRSTDPPVCPPAVVSIAALMVIPPVPVGMTCDESFADKKTLPPRVVMAPPGATVMLFPAISVRPNPLPAFPLASIALVIVMLFVA